MEKLKNEIWSAALKVVERRTINTSELQKKLMEKFPNEEGLILEVLSELERLHLIDDKRYAEQLINHLTQKAIGRLKIRNEARKRGISAEQVDELLMTQGYNEVEFAKKALEQKERTLREADARKRKHKLQQFLRSRGFTDSVIYEVL